MNAARIPLALVLAAAALAGCNKSAPPTLGDGTAPASAPPAAASSASGPIIAPRAASAQPNDGQRQAGATLASQGGGGSVAPCSSCHGANGEGNAAMSAPRLAGQAYAYLHHELESYADGSRAHPVMAPIAKAMTPEQRAAGAAYYASLAAPATPTAGIAASAPAPGIADRGRRLAEFGDETRHVQACSNCHGIEGVGVGSAYPYLAGQHPSYLTATLAAWRDGTRHNDPAGQMPIIAKGLDDAGVQAVVAYYAGLPPPATSRDADVFAPVAAASAGSAVVSGPRGSAQAPQGVGTQQGALTGGAQGPGGAAQGPDAGSAASR
jgi:cytochrome c553